MKKPIGKCHICLNTAKLSEEHIPPKCCRNKTPVIMQYQFKFEKKGKMDRIYQNGSKFYTICESCNNSILAEYDRELGRFYDIIYTNFHSSAPPNQLKIKCKINKITRSIIGKFLGFSKIPDTTQFEQSLRDYILNKTLSSITNTHLTFRVYPYDKYFFARNILPIGNNHFCKIVDCLYFDPLGFMLTRDLETMDGEFEKIQKNSYVFLDLFQYTTTNIEDEVDIIINLSSAYDDFNNQLFPYNFPCNETLIMAIKDSGTSQLATKKST